MKSRTSCLLAIFMMALAPVASSVIINIPGDYPTIQEGINASSEGDTVLVQPGTYIENINFNGHNIVLGSLFLTTGDTDYISSTIIDGNNDGSVVSFGWEEDNRSCITGFTIQGGRSYSGYGGGISCRHSSPIIRNNIIRYNWSFAVGGGIYSMYGSGAEPIIEGNIIANNGASSGHYDGNGGGISIASGTIRRNLIIGNQASQGSSQGVASGGGIYAGGSPLLIENNTICDNSASSPGIDMGGGLRLGVAEGGDVVIRNNIIAFNSSGGGVSGDVDDPTWAGWDYNLVFGNVQYDYDGIEPAPHDIQADPLFVDRFSGDYHLMSVVCGDSSDSPCIDAGDPSIYDDTLDCDWGLGTEISDMGAYGGGGIATDIPTEDNPVLPSQLSLYQNYPNPFNPSTTIRYSLPEQSDIRIEIYDFLGRKVETLVQGEQPAGYHQVVWDGKDKNGKMVSTGIYFYELYVDDYRESKAMILIK